jgi:hypothetical protein
MTQTDADKFLNQAEECLLQAERAISTRDKEEWLRHAEEWMKLARTAKERADRISQWPDLRKWLRMSGTVYRRFFIFMFR